MYRRYWSGVRKRKMVKKCEIFVYAGEASNAKLHKVTFDYDTIKSLRDSFYNNGNNFIKKETIFCPSWENQPFLKVEGEKLYAITYKQKTISKQNVRKDVLSESILAEKNLVCQREIRFYQPNKFAENLVLKNILGAYDQWDYFCLKDIISSLSILNDSKLKINQLPANLQNTVWLAGILGYEPQNEEEIKLKNDFIQALTIEQIPQVKSLSLQKSIDNYLFAHWYEFFTEKAMKYAFRDYSNTGRLVNKIFGWDKKSQNNYDVEKVSKFTTLINNCVQENACLNGKILQTSTCEMTHKVS